MCQPNFYYYSLCIICQRQTLHKNGVCTSCYPQVEFPTQFNYECPHCHGKFNTPNYKWISTEIKEIGVDTTVANFGQGYYGYVCPFCHKIMEGLNA